MDKNKIRNVAIIAHVDHGKTTLVDQLFKQSGLFRDNQDVKERLMDSIDQERERGITIRAKNGACQYKDHFFNIIDTPGHADFGGEVERVLKMSDGVLFLVDAQEGPMPQSYFVLKKAIALNLPVIVVVNKIDKPQARCDWVIDQVFDLLVSLGAPDDTLDFPILYASAKDGIAGNELDSEMTNILPIFDSIIENIPAPMGEVDDKFQFLVSSIDYSSFLGRLAIGKITSGNIKLNQEVIVTSEDEILNKARVTKIYQFQVDQKVEISSASVGQIVALSGLSEVKVGQTISDPELVQSIPSIPIDPPTLSMTFMANDSPFSGRDGEFVTGNQLKDRLFKEILSDVALKVEDLGEGKGYKVSGRGELHLSILIEKLLREGYEFQVSRPTVILKETESGTLEPYEELTIEVPEEFVGSVIERLGERKGICIEMGQDGGTNRLIYKIPTRGLLGYYSEFMSSTKGMGVMYYRFLEYDQYVGQLKARKNGVMISNQTGSTIAYALFNLQDRGVLFLSPGVDIYEGQIIGEHCRSDDLIVNPIKGKKLTNVRASGSDDAVLLTPPLKMSLEQCLSYIDDNELVECTPKEIRLRKRVLSESDRKRLKLV
ncbi:translational GTPase TypA [Candidatus Marinamargulisbacteria bacterium SCGC AG-410-N11]|nr:translational GTPase TypA [Candidatus Marinamargulisbacteria bacterium SCGC AG-410-N11]